MARKRNAPAPVVTRQDLAIATADACVALDKATGTARDAARAWLDRGIADGLDLSKFTLKGKDRDKGTWAIFMADVGIESREDARYGTCNATLKYVWRERFEPKVEGEGEGEGEKAAPADPVDRLLASFHKLKPADQVRFMGRLYAATAAAEASKATK